MKYSSALRCSVAAILSLTPLPALAQADAAASLTQAVTHPDVVSHHRAKIGGHDLPYDVRVETTEVTDSGNRPGARLVSFAYLATNAGDPSKRPIIFLFNGGPIVPSIYIHIGGIGPKRIRFPDDPTADAAALRLADNPDSPLDAADLVFIDPASTGFSRVQPGVDPKSYFTVRADAQQVTAFIQTWLKNHNRLDSPKYIVGESYGSIRAPEVGAQLAELPQPILLDGMILMGQATNIIEYSQRPANILSYVLSLPTLAAISWYHNRVDRHGRSLEQFIAEARAFAGSEYLDALYRGHTIGAEQKARVAARLESFSGIPASYYAAHDLRITKEQFRVELLRDKGLLMGSADARYTAPIGPNGGAEDPANRVIGRIGTFFKEYLRNDLKVEWSDPYLTDSPVADRFHWDYGGGATPFTDWPFPDRINKVMRANPRFRLFVANGDYDTSTTIGGAAYLFDQQGWPKDRAQLHFYQGGHMAYTLDATATAFGNDLRSFIRAGQR